MSLYTRMLVLCAVPKRPAMNTRVVSLALLGSVLLAACGKEKPAEKAASTANAEALNADLTERFVKAWNAGDAASLSSAFTADAIRVLGRPEGIIVGAEAIRSGLEETFKVGSALHQSHLKATTSQIKFISDNIVIGAGTFDILDKNDKSIQSGKWGNVSRYENGKLLVLMESAYVTPADSTSTTGKGPAIVFEPSMASTGPDFDKVQASVNQYITHFNARDFDRLSALYAEDGIMSTGSVAAITVGREAIKKARQAQKMDAASTLRANILGYRSLDNTIAIAYGQWQDLNAKGEVIASGQWGNVFRLEATQAQMLMESAGTIQK